MSTFLLKKFVAALFFPLTLSAELMILGLLFLLATKRRALGTTLLSIGAGILLIASNTLFSSALINPLERQYPALLEVASLNVGPPVKWVVVLGGGNTEDPTIPTANRISGQTLMRLIEGICIYRRVPGSRLILSGGPVYGSLSDASAMAAVAEDLGVPPSDIVLESKSMETETEAEQIKPLVGKDRFVMVTSASHMPRAVALFQKIGLSPIPAPTDFSKEAREGFSPAMVYPSTLALLKSERVVYEFLGRVWAWVRGKA